MRKLQSPSNWNVAQKVATKPRPLADVIEDLKRKVLEAACAIQTQLTQSTSRGSAEQLASARSSTTQQSKFEHSDGPAAQDFLDFPENPIITHLRERQKKRKASAAADEAPRVAADGDAQEPPVAMVKTSRRKPKRQADGDPAASSSSAVQPAPKRTQQRLIIEAFPMSARESQELQDLDLQDLGAASSTSAAQTPQLQQFEQRMRQLLAELGKVSLGRVGGSAAIELQTMLAEFRLLLSRRSLFRKKS